MLEDMIAEPTNRELGVAIQNLAHAMQEGFAHADERFRHIDERFAHIDERFNSMDDRFIQSGQTMRDGFARVDTKIAQVETSLNKRIDRLEEGLNRRFDQVEDVVDDLSVQIGSIGRRAGV